MCLPDKEGSIFALKICYDVQKIGIPWDLFYKYFFFPVFCFIQLKNRKNHVVIKEADVQITVWLLKRFKKSFQFEMCGFKCWIIFECVWEDKVTFGCLSNQITKARDKAWCAPKWDVYSWCCCTSLGFVSKQLCDLFATGGGFIKFRISAHPLISPWNAGLFIHIIKGDSLNYIHIIKGAIEVRIWESETTGL